MIAFTTDWRFSPERSREIVDALVAARKGVSYAEIDSANGHDAFLIPSPRYMKTFAAYMNRVADPSDSAPATEVDHAAS